MQKCVTKFISKQKTCGKGTKQNIKGDEQWKLMNDHVCMVNDTQYTSEQWNARQVQERWQMKCEKRGW